MARGRQEFNEECEMVEINSLGIEKPTAGQQFTLGMPITIIAPMIVTSGSWSVYLAVTKMDTLPPTSINLPGFKIELTPSTGGLIPASNIAGNVFTPTQKGKYTIWAVADGKDVDGNSVRLVQSVVVEVV